MIIFSYSELLENACKEKPPKKSSDFLALINEAYLSTFNGLFNTAIDFTLSGATCVTLFVDGKDLYCANVGDSRALLSKFNDGDWFFVQLSNDHKPDLPKERERIISKGGVVHPLQDENGEFVGPERVWAKGDNKPGLAMSRSIGDHVGALVGISAEPEFVHLQLKDEDKFIVIASDGVWEFLHNEDVIAIVEPFYRRNDNEGAAEALVKESRKHWEKNVKSRFYELGK